MAARPRPAGRFGDKQGANVLETKQQVLTSLTKLGDRDTQRHAVNELHTIVGRLDGPGIPMFLSCLYEIENQQKAFARKETVLLFGEMASVHGDALTPHLARVVAAIARRFKDPDTAVREACAEAMGTLAQCVEPPPVPAGSSGTLMGVFFKPLFDALNEQNQNVQMAASLVLARVIAFSKSPVEANVPRLCAKMAKVLHSSTFAAKGLILKAFAKLVEVTAAAVMPHLAQLLPLILDELASNDWTARKAAAEALASLACRLGPLLSPFRQECLTRLEQARFDKVKPARETAVETYQLFRELPSMDDEGDEDGAHTPGYGDMMAAGVPSTEGGNSSYDGGNAGGGSDAENAEEGGTSAMAPGVLPQPSGIGGGAAAAILLSRGQPAGLGVDRSSREGKGAGGIGRDKRRQNPSFFKPSALPTRPVAVDDAGGDEGAGEEERGGRGGGSEGSGGGRSDGAGKEGGVNVNREEHADPGAYGQGAGYGDGDGDQYWVGDGRDPRAVAHPPSVIPIQPSNAAVQERGLAATTRALGAGSFGSQTMAAATGMGTDLGTGEEGHAGGVGADGAKDWPGGGSGRAALHQSYNNSRGGGMGGWMRGGDAGGLMPRDAGGVVPAPPRSPLPAVTENDFAGTGASGGVGPAVSISNHPTGSNSVSNSYSGGGGSAEVAMLRQQLEHVQMSLDQLTQVFHRTAAASAATVASLEARVAALEVHLAQGRPAGTGNSNAGAVRASYSGGLGAPYSAGGPPPSSSYGGGNGMAMMPYGGGQGAAQHQNNIPHQNNIAPAGVSSAVPSASRELVPVPEYPVVPGTHAQPLGGSLGRPDALLPRASAEGFGGHEAGGVRSSQGWGGGWVTPELGVSASVNVNAAAGRGLGANGAGGLPRGDIGAEGPRAGSHARVRGRELGYGDGGGVASAGGPPPAGMATSLIRENAAAAALPAVPGPWAAALDLLREGRLEEAYRRVLAEQDELLLVRLMGRTGPVIRQLGAATAVSVVAAVVHLLRQNSFVEAVLPWLEQLMEVPGDGLLGRALQADVVDVLGELSQAPTHAGEQALRLVSSLQAHWGW